MRVLVSRRLSTDPRRVRIRRTRHGKPVIESPGDEVHVNVSHTAGLGLVVLGDGPVGVDVERTVPIPDLPRLADIACTPQEYESLFALHPQDRGRAFLRCWTSKEAVLKAAGFGLRLSLQDFTVELRPHEPPTLLASTSPRFPRRWKLVDIPTPPQWIATAAIPRDVDAVQTRTFDFGHDPSRQ